MGEERYFLTATCKKCKHEWEPFGHKMVTLPYQSQIKCPECGHEEKARWLDSETNRKLFQKRLGLNENEKLSEKIKNLEAKVSILEKEMDILKQQGELNNEKVQSVKNWSEKREQDFKDIEMLAGEMKEAEKMKEDGA